MLFMSRMHTVIVWEKEGNFFRDASFVKYRFCLLEQHAVLNTALVFYLHLIF